MTKFILLVLFIKFYLDFNVLFTAEGGVMFYTLLWPLMTVLCKKYFNPLSISVAGLSSFQPCSSSAAAALLSWTNLRSVFHQQCTITPLAPYRTSPTRERDYPSKKTLQSDDGPWTFKGHRPFANQQPAPSIYGFHKLHYSPLLYFNLVSKKRHLEKQHGESAVSHSFFLEHQKRATFF